MKVILSINAGSSSVKVSVYTVSNGGLPRQIAAANVNGLTVSHATMGYSRHGETIIKDRDVESVQNQHDAVKLLLDTFVKDTELSEIGSENDITIACHRIVHGGSYDGARVITKHVYSCLEELASLAPLHNGIALSIVESCMKWLPNTTQVACFDTQFHATIPCHISTYPINQIAARKGGLRKYGFHGISYAFISRSVSRFLGKDCDALNMITLHLGSGASACAIKGGKSWDTSMGLTPLSGLPGATRCGDIDPSLVFHYADHVEELDRRLPGTLHIADAEDILNHGCGWKSLTATTDFASIASSSEPECVLAFDLMVDRICGFIGSYFVSLEGRVDALVFAGGIGEHCAALRRAVVRRVGCLGFSLDEERNDEIMEGRGVEVRDIGSENSCQRVLVCETDEQFEIARICADNDKLW